MDTRTRRDNWMAAAGLIASNLGFFVLFVGGIGGIILSAVALRRSRDPEIGGRGTAIAGILVGILSLVSSGLLTWVLCRSG